MKRKAEDPEIEMNKRIRSGKLRDEDQLLLFSHEYIGKSKDILVLWTRLFSETCLTERSKLLEKIIFRLINKSSNLNLNTIKDILLELKNEVKSNILTSNLSVQKIDDFLEKNFGQYYMIVKVIAKNEENILDYYS
jgi:hypothetical protein